MRIASGKIIRLVPPSIASVVIRHIRFKSDGRRTSGTGTLPNRFISQPWPYAVAMHLHAAIPVGLSYLWWGAAGVIGVWLTLVVFYNLADAIDSAAHIFGHKLKKQHDESRNLAWMGIVVLGEGWHANHHRFPYSARHGLRRGQFDWTWQVIRALQAAGLATEVRVPTNGELIAADLHGE